MTAPARLLFLMMSSIATRSSRDVQRIAIQQVSSRLRVAADRRQRLAQLVRERAGELSEHGDPAQMRQFRLCASVSSSARLRSVMSLTMLRILSPSQRTMHAS